MSDTNAKACRNDVNPPIAEGAELEPCIGMLELSSVARGVEVTDAVLWEAQVECLVASPVQPGKYVLLFTGSVDDCKAGLARGAELAGSDLIDQLLIPQVHAQVPVALRRRGGTIDGQLDAVGVVETATVASSIVAADLALKAATVDLIDLRVANGLGGKSFLVVTGEVSDVRSAVGAASDSARAAGHLQRDVVIAQPHRDLSRFL
ncbi:BMC domain-containing protein [Engelhardtia mirabilis]|uniref:BMC domain protein n=1 Tax=Engelhardtia mirabilis TaxID=2528011 RepID=A0A518BPW9_9BACT|nr:BMC domain protein [Planctomycetes bacterium Pla133]QDV03347.1 BMC domain protein [Planctomycetes bacterium Pla86]